MQAIVDDLARNVKRPITLEDASGRLVAYSVHEQPVDIVRMETLLRKGASSVTLEALRQRGVYQFIDSSQGVARVQPIPEIGFVGRTCVAIRGADRVLGYLWVVDGDSPFPKAAEEALLRARYVLAQELGKRDSALSVKQEQRDQLLGELCGNDQLDVDSVNRRAKTLGWYPAAPMQAIVVRPGEPDQARASELLSELEDLFAQYAPSSIQGVLGGEIVAVLSGRDVKSSGELPRAITERLGQQDRWASVGTGGPCRGLSHVRRSYLEASSAISLGTKMNKGAHRYDYSTLAPYQLLSCMATCRRAGSYGRDSVERVITYDGLRAGTLFDTLEAFLDFYGRRKAAASRLNIHPNTLDYRIRKVRELTGLDLDDANTRLVVHVWVKALSGRVRASRGEGTAEGEGAQA